MPLRCFSGANIGLFFEKQVFSGENMLSAEKKQHLQRSSHTFVVGFRKVSPSSAKTALAPLRTVVNAILAFQLVLRALCLVHVVVCYFSVSTCLLIVLI